MNNDVTGQISQECSNLRNNLVLQDRGNEVSCERGSRL